MSEPGKVRSWNPDVRPEKLVSAILSVNSGILESGILGRVRRTTCPRSTFRYTDLIGGNVYLAEFEIFNENYF